MNGRKGRIAFFVAVAVVLQTSVSFGSVDQHRCHRWKNPFQLNVANVNAVMAVACTALSHSYNERRQMVYEDSATLFHQWQSEKTASGVRVTGHCAIPLTELKAQNLSPFEIDLEFREVARLQSSAIEVESRGRAAGRSISLVLDHNEFLDPSCSASDVTINSVRHINVGMASPLKAIQDMLTSGRTGVVTSLMGMESWVQGNVSAYFSNLGLQYRMTQFNARHLGVAVAPSPSGSLLHVRSANALDFFEGGKFFAFETDSFGTPTGFLDETLPTNGKFQAYPIPNGAEIRGCTSLIYEGELDYPQSVEMTNCSARIEQSPLKQLSKSGSFRGKLQKESEELRDAQESRRTFRRIEEYLNRQIGVTKKYSPKPHTYESGKAAWTKSDVARGWVIHQRAIEVQGDQIRVIEYRYDKSGASKRIEYSVDITKILG